MKTANLMEEIDRSIKQAALAGTLTEDAIEYFNSLVKVAETKHTENERLLEQKDQVSKALDEVRKERDQLLNQVNYWIDRDTQLTAREKRITELEMTAKCESQRVLDHQNMMAVIFKPGTLRREMFGSIPGFDDNGYSCGSGATSENGTVSDE